MLGPDGSELPDYGNLNSPASAIIWIQQGNTLHIVFIDGEMYESVCAFCGIDPSVQMPPTDIIIKHARFIYSTDVAGLTDLMHACIDHVQQSLYSGMAFRAGILDPPPYPRGFRYKMRTGQDLPEEGATESPVEDVLPRQVPHTKLWDQVLEIDGLDSLGNPDDADSDTERRQE